MSTTSTNQVSGIWTGGKTVAADIVWVSATHVEVMVENGTVLPKDTMSALVLRDFLSLPMRVVDQVGSCVILTFDQIPHTSVIDWISKHMITPETKAIREFMEENAVPQTTPDDREERRGEASEVDAQLADLFRARTRALNHLGRSYASMQAA